MSKLKHFNTNAFGNCVILHLNAPNLEEVERSRTKMNYPTYNNQKEFDDFDGLSRMDNLIPEPDYDELLK